MIKIGRTIFRDNTSFMNYVCEIFATLIDNALTDIYGEYGGPDNVFEVSSVDSDENPACFRSVLLSIESVNAFRLFMICVNDNFSRDRMEINITYETYECLPLATIKYFVDYDFEKGTAFFRQGAIDFENDTAGKLSIGAYQDLTRVLWYLNEELRDYEVRGNG